MEARPRKGRATGAGRAGSEPDTPRMQSKQTNPRARAARGSCTGAACSSLSSGTEAAHASGCGRASHFGKESGRPIKWCLANGDLTHTSPGLLPDETRSRMLIARYDPVRRTKDELDLDWLLSRYVTLQTSLPNATGMATKADISAGPGGTSFRMRPVCSVARRHLKHSLDYIFGAQACNLTRASQPAGLHCLARLFLTLIQMSQQPGKHAAAAAPQ